MPKSRETYVKLTVEEYEQHLRDAAKEAARQVLDELPTGNEIDRRSRVEMGLVTVQDIAALYSVTDSTARRWVSELEPVNPNRRPHLYAVEDLPDAF